MGSIPDSLYRLIDEFSRFPGIGKKTAQRMAYQVLKYSNAEAVSLAQAVMDLKTKILTCSLCGGITEQDPCHTCSDTKRDRSIICIVEESDDIYVFEKTNTYRGLYHVLGGVLSPLDGVGPDELNLDTLLKRLEGVIEVVLAVNPSIEGEATALYIGKLLTGKGIKVTRLARGLPVGGDLEFIDDATLVQALEGRTLLE